MISKAGREFIKRYESLRLKAYQDSAGVWTIGYGHTRTASEGMVITEIMADILLDEDIEHTEYQLGQFIDDVDLKPCQHDALVSFVFNVGIGNFSTSTLYKLLKENPNDCLIGVEFPKWQKSGGKRLRGLLLRRLDEAKMYFQN